MKLSSFTLVASPPHAGTPQDSEGRASDDEKKKLDHGELDGAEK